MKLHASWLFVLVVGFGLVVTSTAHAQKARMRAYEKSLEQKMDSMMKQGRKCQINLGESNDGDGQDVELRFTMPVNEFMEFAPVAALEAAAIPHKFPVVYIYLREETTDRVARVAFRDAEPLAGRYLAGDKEAVEDMKDTLIWH